MSKRFYVAWSSVFNSAPYYQVDRIKQALSAAGFKQVRTALQFGWSNQPSVVTFSGDPTQAATVLQAELGHDVIIRAKDWK